MSSFSLINPLANRSRRPVDPKYLSLSGPIIGLGLTIWQRSIGEGAIMPKLRSAVLTLSPTGYLLAFLGALELWLGSGSLDLAFAQPPYDDVKTSEGWVWSRIKQGKVADFDQRCGTPQLDLNERKTGAGETTAASSLPAFSRIC
jgi:hypothetical protein